MIKIFEHLYFRYYFTYIWYNQFSWKIYIWIGCERQKNKKFDSNSIHSNNNNKKTALIFLFSHEITMSESWNNHGTIHNRAHTYTNNIFKFKMKEWSKKEKLIPTINKVNQLLMLIIWKYYSLLFFDKKNHLNGNFTHFLIINYLNVFFASTKFSFDIF